MRLPHRPQAPLHLHRRPPAKRHAHSGRALAPVPPRRRPPMLGRCPLWPLATLSCSAPRRCATRACWEWRRLETLESCPKWNEVPKDCGFKVERLGSHRCYATREEKTTQCRVYGQFKNWALKACGLAEEEVKEHLTKAASLRENMRGRGDLPQAFRRQHSDYDGKPPVDLLCRTCVDVGRQLSPNAP